MSRIPPSFSEYGAGGDAVGTRRARHAFRWCVLLCATFTAVLWFSERFLRYEHAERLYLSALTKPPEQARVFLRQAVLYDEKQREFPTPKYQQALAEREEADLVLPAYEKARARDPGNAALAIRYGCRLFAAGEPVEAQARFQEAGKNAPNNALPAYLEAAVLPWVGEDNSDLRQSLALIARTNSSGKSITFPRPLWSSDLPQSGYWYTHLRRRIVLECSEPFYEFVGHVVATAEEQFEQKQTQNWDSWLEHLETMGRRITADALPQESSGPAGQAASGASIQACTGLYIQISALRERERVNEIELGRPDTKLIERRLQLESTLAELTAFENGRLERIDADRERHRLPIRLCGYALAVLFACVIVSHLAAKAVHASGPSTTLPHSSLGKAAFGIGPGVLLLMLCLCVLIHPESAGGAWARIVTTGWWLVLVVMAWFGLAYPALTLPSVSDVCRDQQGDNRAELLQHARRERRAAWVALARRYYGIVAGLTVCVVCVWVILYRVFVSLYPWQTELLATGLEVEEIEIVRRVLSALY
ncbi:MAG: hypothetical protein JXR94_10320 [Candidatus Hydrogenedentes bacterium]|nr:hypothetical protein [Candidatus Hydrogenedentota bacterium]